MRIGVTEEHEALHDAARRWVRDRCPPSVAREAIDADPTARPSAWDDLAGQGWTGLHVSEEDGGIGYGALEVAVVLDELGAGVVPGPYLPTVVAAQLVTEHGGDELRRELLPAIAEGSVTAAVAVEGPRPVLCGPQADLVVAEVDGTWAVLDASGLAITSLGSLDATRPLGAIDLDGVEVDTARVLDGLTAERVRQVFATFAAAEAAGIATWCLDTAVDYAKVREQFGRPIGQFQAVKHRCAELLVDVERTRAAAWDAARAIGDPEASPLTAAVAATIAFDAAYRCAKDCIQILGGIGFTWEHDAHLYLRRATAVRELVQPARWRAEVASLARAGARRRLGVALPESAEAHRETARAFLASLDGVEDAGERRRLMAEEGYLVPHLPRPWGRDADPVEQLVIDEEFRAAGVDRPGLQIGTWVVPTLIQYGTDEQQERWLRPTLHGEIAWCQMFSEPGAGSDLASLQTKATKVEGGWLLTGQKVWTSLAHRADLSICLARTNPDAPKHEGITYFIVDMQAEGVDVRPLTELTGHALFNEVFLSDVLVPDDHVIGEVDGGWRIARTTLANERVAMSSGTAFGGGLESAIDAVEQAGRGDDPLVADRLGGLLADGQALSVLGLRSTLRQLSGADPGAGSSVRKLFGVEHEQRVSEFSLDLLGPEAATTEGTAGARTHAFLANRCLTIAGGTSEVQRNVIAERLLGLPRDPEP